MTRLLCCLSLVLATSGCAGIVRAKPPVMSPTVNTAVTVGLEALDAILKAQPNVPPVVLLAIEDTQRAIALDLSGATWGELIRTMLTTVYGELPPTLQANRTIAGLVDGLEAGLATVGA